MASARPATGRAPSNRQPVSVSGGRANAAPSSRRPASLQTAHTGANNKAHAAGVANGQNKGNLSNVTRSLTTADNNQLATLQPTLSSAQAKAGITAALDGKPMTTAQVNALRATLNSNLPASDKAVIAKALQTDQQIKRQLATNNAINGLATGSLLGGLGGNGGGIGGLGGNGGGSGGLGGNGGGSGGSGGSDGGGSSSGGGGGGDYPSSGDGDASSPIIASGPVGGAPSPAPAYASGAESVPAEEGEGGVLLQAVEAGAAAERAGLRTGDVILSFGEFRTRTFEELQAAVRQPGGPVKVIFINGENGQTEYLTVEPEGGRIGVTCD
jgi:hypothetical protein